MRTGNLDFGGTSRALNLPAPISSGQPLVAGLIYPIGGDITIAEVSLAPGTSAFVANTLRAWPWVVKAPVLLSQVRLEITAVAAGLARCGLYAPNAAGYPEGLITVSDAGEIDTSTTGVKLLSYSSNIVLPPGLFYLSALSNGGASSRSVAVGAISAVLGQNPAGGASSIYTAWTIARTYGALPATFPAGATRLANVGAPAAMFRVV